MQLLIKSGYDPAPMVRLQEIFVRLGQATWQDWNDGLLGGHPPDVQRVIACRQELQKMTLQDNARRLGTENFNRRIARLNHLQPAYDAHADGVLALMAGDVDKAMRLSNKAIALAPQVADFHGLQGSVYLRTGRYQDAEASFTQAIERDNSHYRYLLLRGLVRKSVGNREGAKDDLTRSTALRPTRLGHQVLGALYMEDNDGNRAYRHFMLATGGQLETINTAKHLHSSH